jgi:hypothetical protein
MTLAEHGQTRHEGLRGSVRAVDHSPATTDRRSLRSRCRQAGWAAALALAPLLLGLVAHAAPVAASTTIGGGYPVSGTQRLWDIACATATTCYAVGQSSTSVGVIVPVTNHGIPGSPQPVPGTENLAGIACPTSTICYAVGWTASSEDEGVVVTVPVGGTPTVQPLSGTQELSAIACSSSTVCVAAGPGTGIVPLPSPGPTIVTIPTTGSPRVQPVGLSVAFNGIGCTAQTCYAVGAGNTGGGPTAAVVTVSGSGAPTTELIAIPALEDISCIGTTCYAVGDGAYVVTLNQGGTFSVSQTPNASWFSGIACPTRSFCAEVGRFQGSPVVAINPASASPDLELDAETLRRLACLGSYGTYTCYAVGWSGSDVTPTGAVETITVSSTIPPPCKPICQ